MKTIVLLAFTTFFKLSSSHQSVKPPAIPYFIAMEYKELSKDERL